MCRIPTRMFNGSAQDRMSFAGKTALLQGLRIRVGALLALLLLAFMTDSMVLGAARTASGVELTLSLMTTGRVVVVGDSISYGGQYLEYLETALRLGFPDRPVDLLNLALPSETVSGLSEPGHAGGSFPRPDLHERLGRVLEKTHPDLVVACYGMNDGIYYPLGSARFAAFRSGAQRLRDAAIAAGARFVILTPPVFDPIPLKGRTLPDGLHEYRSPFEGYNQVLDRYSDWLVTQRTNGWEVIDIHGPMNRHLAEMRKNQPGYLLSPDGVHLNNEGHWMVARLILEHLGLKDLAVTDVATLLKKSPNGAELLDVVQRRQRALKDSMLTATGHRRPGMGKGEPLDAAQRTAADLASKAKSLASGPH